MNNNRIELKKDLITIMKELPDSGAIHPETFAQEAKLRMNGLDVWMDGESWYTSYIESNILGRSKVTKSLESKIIPPADLTADIDILNVFTPYVPDFEETLI